MLLKDQVALVTGGSRGIGRGIVLALAREGAKVCFVYRGNAEAAAQLEQEVTASGGFVKGVQADVADPAAADRVVAGVMAEHGRLDILVNNAGVIRDKLFVQMEADDWNTVITTNLNGVFAFCKAVSKQMVFKQRSGRIVNVSSIAAEHVNKGQANYAASKGAINSFTRVLAAELGARNVLVNAVAPGFIATDMSQAVRNMAGEDSLKKLIPVKRLGTPEDIANVVVFLCSPAAAYITGQVITVDGGLSLGGVRLIGRWENRDMNDEQIFAMVRTTLVDALSVDDEQVTRSAGLKGDLGAESIDFLDIVFRLERQFGITIPREELFPESIFQGDATFVSGGKVTPVGLAALEKQMPYADLTEFKKDPRLDKVEDLFTVELLVRYLQRRLAK